MHILVSTPLTALIRTAASGGGGAADAAPASGGGAADPVRQSLP